LVFWFLSFWFLSFWFLVFKFLVFGFWFLVFGIWYLVFGIWYLVFGIWYLVFGIWYSKGLNDNKKDFCIQMVLASTTVASTTVALTTVVIDIRLGSLRTFSLLFVLLDSSSVKNRVKPSAINRAAMGVRITWFCGKGEKGSVHMTSKPSFSAAIRMFI